MGFELAGDSANSVARRGCCKQGSGKHKGCSEGEADSEDAPQKSCMWLAEKPVLPWTPLNQAPGPVCQPPAWHQCPLLLADLSEQIFQERE